MRHGMCWVLGFALALPASRASAQPTTAPSAASVDLLKPMAGGLPLSPDDQSALAPLAGKSDQPVMADQVVDDNSIYAVPPPPKEDEGVNNGAVHVDLNVAYFNRYVYRGVDHDQVSRRGNALNLTVDAKLSFDTGQYPHPFVGVFTSVYDSDPVSRFQEIRPYFGVEWNLRPFLIEAGDISYIYPERESDNTAEVYAKLTIDDSLIFHTEHPVLSPYVLAAYDYTVNHGEYFEAGFSHDFVFDDIGFTITPKADIAYIVHFPQQFVFVNTLHDTGWQHMDVGITGTYSLNTLLNISKRYGEFDLKGYIFYTEKVSRSLLANNVVWGGGGIGFKY